jgi:hypothetical protein
MKKVEAWMDSTDFNCELGDCECEIHSSQEECETRHLCIEMSRDARIKCVALRVYVFNADEYDKANLPSKINEKALQDFVDGLKLGFPPETDREILEKTFPEIAHITPRSSERERLIAFAKLRKRLGLTYHKDD